MAGVHEVSPFFMSLGAAGLLPWQRLSDLIAPTHLPHNTKPHNRSEAKTLFFFLQKI